MFYPPIGYKRIHKPWCFLKQISNQNHQQWRTIIRTEQPIFVGSWHLSATTIKAARICHLIMKCFTKWLNQEIARLRKRTTTKMSIFETKIPAYEGSKAENWKCSNVVFWNWKFHEQHMSLKTVFVIKCLIAASTQHNLYRNFCWSLSNLN